MSSAVLVVVVVVLVVFGPTVYRMRDMSPPAIVWPLIFGTIGLLAFITYDVLHPPEPSHSYRYARIHETDSFDVPAGSSLLITGVLMDDEKGPDAGKTDYALSLQGNGWTQQCTDLVSRKTDGGGGIVAGEQRLDSGNGAHQSRWGENLQGRCDLEGSGTATVELSNWHGGAARAIDVALIRSPFDVRILGAIVAMLIVAAIATEAIWKVDKFGADVGTVALYGVFVRLSTTPLDATDNLIRAGLPAVFFGQFLVGAAAWLVSQAAFRYQQTKAREQAGDPSVVP